MSEDSSDIFFLQENASRPPPIALGINVEKPKFPQYAVFSKRLDSFKNWPEYLPVAKEDLVEAGLVYTGVGDSVRCYFCGGGLTNWERGDVPMEEHAKWYPKCPHILLVKGQAYVDKLSRGEKSDEDGASVQTDSAEARPSHIESIAARSCIEMGYDPALVLKAIDIFVERHDGKSDFKGRDLAEILFEMEEDNFATTCDIETVVGSRQTAEQDMAEEQTLEQIESLKEKNQRIKENQMCKICLDKKADVILLPCGHMVSCPQCAPAMNKCPSSKKGEETHTKKSHSQNYSLPTVKSRGLFR